MHQMTPSVSWGMHQQQQQQFLMTYMPIPHVIPLKRRQLVPAQLSEGVHHIGAQKEINILRNKSAISGSVLGPVHVAAHA